MELKENERIDDLQNSEGFCFGIDSVLLSDFAKDIRNNSRVMDLGTGTGILCVLLSGKTNLKEIYGIEIQPEVADMAKRSVKLNSLQDKVKIINENILNLENVFEKGSFDAIVTNPPYKKINTGLQNESEKKLISRHELTANLEDFIKVSKDMLKDKGEFYMVHRPERLVDIIYLMRKYKIEPKQIRFVAPKPSKEPNLVLIKGVKNAKEFLKFDNILYVYNEDGSYTEELLKIYNKSN